MSETNGETPSPGYAVVNFGSQFELVDNLTLAFGIDNLLNRKYSNHLNGVNRAVNPDIAVGERLPGWGRNAYARLRWDF